jgi:hypothetical protein
MILSCEKANPVVNNPNNGIVVDSGFPIVKGNTWVYKYYQYHQLYQNDSLWAGTISLAISDAINRNDTTFFTISCKDSGTFTRKNNSIITDSAYKNSSDKHIVYFQDSMFSEDILLISNIDIGNLIIHRKVNDTSYNSLQGFIQDIFSRITDSTTITLNGQLFIQYMTIQDSSVQQSFPTQLYSSKDTTEWIDKIGIFNNNFSAFEGSIGRGIYETDTVLVGLASFNGITISASPIHN